MRLFIYDKVRLHKVKQRLNFPNLRNVLREQEIYMVIGGEEALVCKKYNYLKIMGGCICFVCLYGLSQKHSIKTATATERLVVRVLCAPHSAK